MINKMTERLEFQGNALLLRAERQRTIASNIANADTPGYVARDFKFGDRQHPHRHQPRRHGLCRTDATQPGQQHRRPGPRARQLG